MFTLMTVLTVVFFAALSGTASAADGDPSPFVRPPGWTGPTAGTVITLPDNTRATLPKDWPDMTISDLEAIGLRPGMTSSWGPRVVDRYFPSSGLQPYNAYGCDGWVCIQVISPSNDGLTVSNWYTSADNPGGYVCTYSAYWDSLTHIFDTGTSVCGWSPGQFRGSLTYPVRHPYNWTACNTWVHISGKPCESITP